MNMQTSFDLKTEEIALHDETGTRYFRRMDTVNAGIERVFDAERLTPTSPKG